ncbi:hypothetical protein ACJMK2_010479 [Sinanodonta woodiana]|uniref:Putative rRNA methyltransferase n=1 Tax=Sinanodonta woodiana TaxID=1069815 RepID=A0ABD3VH30_SINWO
MGKKTKIGKARRDRFYKLAKESGYRSRAAFKLIQLNRKFEFLQKSRVVIDLCAAPGGWLQVAAENTPISSLIIGIDLVPIRPIQNCITLQEDITTEKCRQAIKKEIQTWKADCVLHDGSPNIGKNWLHDAFQQNQLTLTALKLAAEFLKKGGCFVTKIFRSKDYNSLLWVFQQLFHGVNATKPQASRNESAEIFVVCQGFLAPDKLDPKFFDVKHVFEDVEKEATNSLNLIHPEKKRRQRQGYPEGDYTLFHSLPVSKFLQSDGYLQLLADASEVILDDDRVAQHPATTNEIKECLKDIKVLGRKDIRGIISWRNKMKKAFYEEKGEVEIPEVEESEDDEAKIDEKLAEVREEERKNLKRKLKKVRKEKIKLQHKMDLNMILPDDQIDITDDKNLFDVSRIKSKKQLDEVEASNLDFLDRELDGDEGLESDNEIDLPVKKVTSYDRGTKDYLDPMDASEDEYTSDVDLSDEKGIENDNDEEEEEAETNPLIITMEDKDVKTQRKLKTWFEKDSFAGLEDEEDEDLEIQKMAEDYRKKGGVILEKKKIKESKVELDSGVGDEPKDSLDDDMNGDLDIESESSSDSEYDMSEFVSQKDGKSAIEKVQQTGGIETVAADDSSAIPKLDPTGLAIGAAMVSSRKRRREIIENGYNRYMFDDEGLPSWFVQEERRHLRRVLTVTKEAIQEYREKLKAIDARPIKKIAEARARKKRKMMKKLERARKKSEAITDTQDVSEREKWQQIKNIYKKAGLLSSKKKEVTYVVAKKGTGKKVRRPNGVAGPFRVVDKRMKKDNMRVKKQSKQERQSKKRGSKGARGKGRR